MLLPPMFAAPSFVARVEIENSDRQGNVTELITMTTNRKGHGVSVAMQILQRAWKTG